MTIYKNIFSKLIFISMLLFLQPKAMLSEQAELVKQKYILSSEIVKMQATVFCDAMQYEVSEEQSEYAQEKAALIKALKMYGLYIEKYKSPSYTNVMQIINLCFRNIVHVNLGEQGADLVAGFAVQAVEFMESAIAYIELTEKADVAREETIAKIKRNIEAVKATVSSALEPEETSQEVQAEGASPDPKPVNN